MDDPETTSTSLMADVMIKSTLESLASTLMLEGPAKAQQRWLELNDAYSDNEWWWPVAKAKRKLFADYMAEQKASEAASVPTAANATIIIGGNLNGAQQQWADQLVGLAEGDVVKNKIKGS